MTVKPRKPWRVTVTGPDVRACLGEDSPADAARVEQWEDGRWRHFETMHADEMPKEPT